MLPPVPLDTSLVASSITLLTGAILVRVGAPTVWRARWARRGAAALVLLIAMAHSAWSMGARAWAVSGLGMTVAVVLLPCMLLVVLTMPFAFVAHRLAVRLLLRRAPAQPLAPLAPSFSRRTLVRGAAASVPLAALGTGLAGFVSPATRIRTVPLRYTDLPSALDGLRILQLSDLHLGCTKSLSDLEALFDSFGAHRPDMIVFTGDIAEDVRLAEPALRLATSLHPRLGTYACLGNHEYLHDIAVTRPALERSGVPLLVDSGLTLETGNARIHLAGANDPVFMHSNIRDFMQRSVDAALDGAPSDAFHVLLSHRPEGFVAAANRGLALTLSGHTHGGQIGFNGKSAFQPLFPDGYLWGSYARGASRLYTTAGFGDWYPFRLGCPTEAALIVLQREPIASRTS